MDLPDEIWNSIFDLLGHYRHFKFISSVSRRLLSITNGLRRSLTITNEVIPFLPSLLRRFPNIDEIKIRVPHVILDSVLYHISVSNIVISSISFPDQTRFPVDGLRHLGSKMWSSLRVLNCSNMSGLTDDHLVTIMNLFPFLEDLDISHEYHKCPSPYEKNHRCPERSKVSDDGIHLLTLSLTKLSKIELSGNDRLTDQSIISLSLNCSVLKKLGIRRVSRYSKSTPKGIGIGMVLRDCDHLNYISVEVRSTDENFSKSFVYARNLHELDLSFLYDEYLYGEIFSDLAEANLPLKKLVLGSTHTLTDRNVAEISKSLRNLTCIKLSYCRKLTSSAFFTIIGNCHFLSDIVMMATELGIIEKFRTDFPVNDKVKCIYLCYNSKMCNELMKRIPFTCPNLEKLDVSYCRGITVEGMNAILRNCHEIKHLDITDCSSVTKFDINVQVPNLQVLRARKLQLDDKSLEIIGKRCNGLLYLDLEACNNVSCNGVIKVLKLCQRLRRINLMSCTGVVSETMLSLLLSRSSLRKLTPLCEIGISESEKEVFLQSIRHLDLFRFEYEIYCD